MRKGYGCVPFRFAPKLFDSDASQEQFGQRVDSSLTILHQVFSEPEGPSVEAHRTEAVPVHGDTD